MSEAARQRIRNAANDDSYAYGQVLEEVGWSFNDTRRVHVREWVHGHVSYPGVQLGDYPTPGFEERRRAVIVAYELAGLNAVLALTGWKRVEP